MQKIITGLLSLTAVLALAGGSAYALWSDSLPVNNVGLSTGDGALLQFSRDGVTDWVDAYTFDNAETLFADAYPGYENFEEFYVRNHSAGDFSLLLSGRITGNTGDFDAVKTSMQVKFTNDPGTQASNYFTLDAWKAGELPTNILVPAGDVPVKVKMYLKVPVEAGNETAGINVRLDWNFTGAQVAPSGSPTVAPTSSGTASPTASPTVAPTATSTATASPTATPSAESTASPTLAPTESPTPSSTP